MDKKQLKTLKRGDSLRFTDKHVPEITTIVCFVEAHKQKAVISWPNMNGGCPVDIDELEIVELESLSRKERRQHQTAVWGMERYYPENRG